MPLDEYSYYDKLVAAKEKDPKYQHEKKLQEEWLKNNKPKVGKTVDLQKQTIVIEGIESRE